MRLKRLFQKRTAERGEDEFPDAVWKDEQENVGKPNMGKIFVPVTLNHVTAAAIYEGTTDEGINEMLRALDSLLQSDGNKDLKKLVQSGETIYVYPLQTRRDLYRFYSLAKQLKEYVIVYRREKEKDSEPSTDGPYYLLISEYFARQAERILMNLEREDRKHKVLRLGPGEKTRPASNEELFLEGLFLETETDDPDETPFDGRVRRSYDDWRLVGMRFSGQKGKKGEIQKGKTSYL